MTNKEYLNQVMLILENGGIKKAEDLNRQYGDTLTTQTNIYNNYGEGWILDLYKITQKYFDDYVKIMNDSECNRAYFVTNSINENAKKYMCMFPSSLILTDSFMMSSSDGAASYTYNIKTSFFRELIDNSQYIEKDIFTLLPKSFDFNMAYGAGVQSSTLGGHYSPHDNVSYIGNNGVFVENEHISELFITFPWLYGAKTDDYLNIISKYSTHYENYRLLIYKLLKSYKNGEANIKDLCYDIKQAHINMSIQFDLAKSVLCAKGLQTIVGLAFTFIPLCLDISPELKLSLQTILGITSLKDTSSLIIGAKQELKKCGITEPCYISWQWEKKYVNKKIR